MEAMNLVPEQSQVASLKVLRNFQAYTSLAINQNSDRSKNSFIANIDFGMSASEHSSCSVEV